MVSAIQSTPSKLRRIRRLASLLFSSFGALAQNAQAGDTVVFSDGDFGAGWVSNKIVDTTPSAGATFVSTTQLGGIPGSYRNTSHTFSSGVIWVAHFDAQYAHDPSTTPICAIDFAPALIRVAGPMFGAVGYRLALRQAGSTYGGPQLDVFDNFWASYQQQNLHSEDFQIYDGTGPSHPDFSCTGSTIEFGFLTGNSTPSGTVTTVSGIDNWLVTVHLASASWYDGDFVPVDWTSTKINDSTPGALATTFSTTHPTSGAPGAYRETSHTYTNGLIKVAHTNALAIHDPSLEPIYAVDVQMSITDPLGDFGNGIIIVGPAVLQGSAYYGAQEATVANSGWSIGAVWVGLTATKFNLVAGTGPQHPDFTNSGAPLQWGYITRNLSPSTGTTTKLTAVDNWYVKAHLTPQCPGTQGIASCFGDDITNPCPCFPSIPLGGVGRGCPNSIEPRGGRLIGTGTASIANDQVILQGTGMPSSFCMYFQGTTLTGVPFGDGRLCAAGTIVRLAVKLNICNSSEYPASSEPTISVQGGIATPGQRIYQIWYRDSPVSCTPSTYNLTNALAINWTL